MSPTQVQLIRESFAKIEPKATVAALMFYQRLFTLDPSLRSLFRPEIEEQGRKLMQMLGAAVRLLDRPESLLPVLEDLGRRHAGYGVRDEHYGTVGQALIGTLDEALDPEFSPAARAAWTDLYTLVAITMKRGAAEASQLTAAPTGPHHTAEAAR